jgi:hypothetical protein
MSKKNGSPAAIALIEKLKFSGHLIDVYDFDRVKSDNSDDAPFSCADLEEFDEEYGLNYRHHLLAIFVDEELDTKELIKLYPPLSTHFESNSFNPHLIFINLVIRSVMVVKLIGRGRVESYLLPNTNVDFDKFQELDHASVINNLTDALKEIADADYNMVYTEIDEGHIQEAEAEGPDSDGMYLVGSHGDDGEGITASELATAKSELEIYTNSLDDGLYEFRIFFPLRKIQFDNFQADY